MIDQTLLDRLIDQFKQKVIDINQDGPATIITFEDGTTLPLFGGGAQLLGAKPISTCSFCDLEQTNERPLLAPPDRDDPTICPDCAVKAVELFIGHGVDVELDLSMLPEKMKEKFVKFLDQS